MTPNWIKRSSERIMKKYFPNVKAGAEVNPSAADVYGSIKQGIESIIKTQYITRHKRRNKNV